MADFDLDRFAKLMGMFGSQHQGEVANAASLASRMLKDAGLTWLGLVGSLELVAQLTQENERLKADIDTLRAVNERFAQAQRQARDAGRASQSSPGPGQQTYRSHQTIALRLLGLERSNKLPLSEWEIEFLTSIKARDTLTEKQQAVLDKIRKRAGI